MNEHQTNDAALGRGYEIEARPATLGGGWKLTLYQDGQEAGGGVFPPEDESQISLMNAYAEAEDEGESWLGFP
jgi:hypothetical protein